MNKSDAKRSKLVPGQKPETEVETEKVAEKCSVERGAKEKAFCAPRTRVEIEFCSPSDLGDVALGDSSLGLGGAGGDDSSSRS